MLEEVNIGNRYGRLVVISRCGADAHQHRLWLCRCDCGNTVQTRTAQLRRGKCKSCGCLRLDVRKRKRGRPIDTRTLNRFLTGSPTRLKAGSGI